MIAKKYRPTDETKLAFEHIPDHELPVTIEDLVTEYDERIGKRDEFLWKWLHVVLPHVTLSTVPETDKSHVNDAKTVASMYVVLLDDVGEADRDKATLDEAARIPFDSGPPALDRPDVDRDALVVADRIWDELESMLADAPRADEFVDVFEFDLKQTLNAIEYSYLVNEHLEIANLEESWQFDCYNMMLFTYLNVDLMYSPSFDRRDWGAMREVFQNVQRLARIGNWITTWERELYEGDFTSGVVTYALDEAIVTQAELRAFRNGDGGDPERIVRKIKRRDVENHFLERWERIYQETADVGADVESVDVDALLEGMETVLEFHLASRGLK